MPSPPPLSHVAAPHPAQAVVAWYAAAQKREYSAGNKHVEACDVKACGTDRCS